jgi:putative tryptophan/tyrosine transport system substrate-binding protein
MRRRKFIALFGAAGAMWPLGTRAQQGEKVYKIGFLSAGSPELVALDLDALRELGYVEGKNLTFESRYAENDLDRLPKFAAELVSLNVDVIWTVGTLAPLAAKRATSTIPIVMIAAGDPSEADSSRAWPTPAVTSPERALWHPTSAASGCNCSRSFSPEFLA